MKSIYMLLYIVDTNVAPIILLKSTKLNMISQRVSISMDRTAVVFSWQVFTISNNHLNDLL